MALHRSPGQKPGGAAVRDSLDRFVQDVQGLRASLRDEHALADAVADRLGHLLRDPNWLCEAHSQPWDNRYRQHVLYVAPDGGFSVVSLVWRPGQRTSIHDHVSWCVVGVYRGQEEETRYQLHQDGLDQFLVETCRQRALPGQTAALVPPNEDIHAVANAGDDLAISIHVYGANIQELGSSINRKFDHLPIRPEPGSAQPATWRTQR